MPSLLLQVCAHSLTLCKSVSLTAVCLTRLSLARGSPVMPAELPLKWLSLNPTANMEKSKAVKAKQITPAGLRLSAHCEGKSSSIRALITPTGNDFHADDETLHACSFLLHACNVSPSCCVHVHHLTESLLSVPSASSRFLLIWFPFAQHSQKECDHAFKIWVISPLIQTPANTSFKLQKNTHYCLQSKFFWIMRLINDWTGHMLFGPGFLSLILFNLTVFFHYVATETELGECKPWDWRIQWTAAAPHLY